jgi:hypothetical protein
LTAKSAKKIGEVNEEKQPLSPLYSDFRTLYFVLLHLDHRDPLSLPLL